MCIGHGNVSRLKGEMRVTDIVTVDLPGLVVCGYQYLLHLSSSYIYPIGNLNNTPSSRKP